MSELDEVINGLDEITGYSCEQMSLFDNDVFIRGMAQRAIELLKEQQAEIDRLKSEKEKAIIEIESRIEEARNKDARSESEGVYLHGRVFGLKDAISIIRNRKDGEQDAVN